MIAYIGSSQRIGTRAETEARGSSRAEAHRFLRADVLLGPSQTVALPFAFDPADLMLWWASSNAPVSIGRGTPATGAVHQYSIVGGTPTSGSFRLVFGGPSSSTIQWNSTAGALQTALQSVPALAGKVACSGGPFPGTPILATFDTSLGSVGTPSSAFESLNAGFSQATLISPGSAGSLADQWTQNPGPGRAWTRELAAIDPCPFTAPAALLTIANPSSARHTFLRLRAMLSGG